MRVIGLLVASLFFSSVFAQDTTRCGTDALFEQQLQDPKFARSYQKFEKSIRDLGKSRSSFDPVSIPLIVHVVYDGEPYGVGNHFTTEYVEAAIDDLNQNFAGEFSDDPTSNTEISFCIATKSTTGVPIDGIRYYDWEDLGYNYGFNGVYDNAIGFATDIGYDLSNYCNLYIVPFTSPLGFAFTPPSPYGMWVGSQAFGINGNGNYGQNKTIVHEAGHYCGLFHTFHFTSDCESETNCNAQGDRVCDTPPTTGNWGCPINGGACGTDLVNNFMDYTTDDCVNSFTQGQTLRMLSTLESARPGVLNNTLACGSVGGIDANVGNVAIPIFGCITTLTGATFELQSLGDSLTEAIINYDVNGQQETALWAGNLEFGESETIAIPEFNIGFGLVDIEIEVQVVGDVFEDNNIVNYQFDNFDGVTINLEIDFDALPGGFEWVLYEAENGEPIGEPIFESGYEAGIEFNETYACETLTYEFCLEEGEYVVILTDLFGTGMHYNLCNENETAGDITIINGLDTLNYIIGDWGSEEELPFIVEQGCPPLNDCPWDLDQDGLVNNADLLIILGYYNSYIECGEMDFDQDGFVGISDILAIMDNFGYYCDGGISLMDNLIEGSDAQLYETMDITLYENGNYITNSKLYTLQGKELNNTDSLSEGIYVVRQYWDNGFITTKKLYLNKQ